MTTWCGCQIRGHRVRIVYEYANTTMTMQTPTVYFDLKGTAAIILTFENNGLKKVKISRPHNR